MFNKLYHKSIRITVDKFVNFVTVKLAECCIELNYLSHITEASQSLIARLNSLIFKIENVSN